MHISQLFYYPIKSLPGIEVDQLDINLLGPVDDRQWMLVDDDARFYTLRKNPGLYDFSLVITDQAHVIELQFPGESSKILNLQPETKVLAEAKKVSVNIWGDRVNALEPFPDLSKWISMCLETDLKLVYFGPDSQRQVDEAYAKAGQQVAFADGFPLLITNEASLDQFNQWLGREIEMIRFRPNVVVSGADAWMEDHAKIFKTSSFSMDLVKPCTRCTIPTIDPDSEDKQQDVMLALKKYRMSEQGVLFGVNAIQQSEGRLVTGESASWDNS